MIEPEMLYTHVVQANPIENGEPNISKVILECGFETKEQADDFVVWYNGQLHAKDSVFKAVYVGCVNNETGELV